MSTGKSTIVEMIDFCFGGTLVRTPAVTSEVVGVQLVRVPPASLHEIDLRLC
jgi:hypothetical protein